MHVAVLSDVHGNLPALESVLKDIESRVEQVWCLGDIVGYGPNPNECVELVRREDFICVVGNHEWACLGKVDLNDFNPDARRACRWSMEHLHPKNREFLDGLPASLVIDEYTLAHGSPRAPIWEYVTHPSIALENFAFFDTRVCLIGHTHVPLAFYMSEDNPTVCERRWLNGNKPLGLAHDRWILNPGGVGQPRDGDPRASYILLDTEAMEAQLCRVAYPVEETQRQMETAGLPHSLIVRLSFGW